MQYLRAALYVSACLCLVAVSGSAVWVASSVSRIATETTIFEAQAIATLRGGQAGITASLARFDAATDAWGDFSREQLALFRDPKTQRSIGLLLRTGDDLNRGVKRFNELLDDVRVTVKATNEGLNGQTGALRAASAFIGKTDLTVNGSVLPAATDLLNRSGVAVDALRVQINATGAGFGQLAGDGSRALKDIDALVNDPSIRATLLHVEQGTAAGAKSLEHVEVVTERWSKPPRLIWKALESVGGFFYKIVW